MFLYFSLFFLVISSSGCTVIRIPLSAPKLSDQLTFEEVQVVNRQTSPWLDHVMDFANLIDTENVLEIIVTFIDDPEAMRFIGFLFGPKFKEIIWQIEIMDEVQEAYKFLQDKGYDMQPVIDAINSDFNLPPFKAQPLLRYEKGVSGLIATVIGSLPIEDMKKLFKFKLDKSPEFAELFDVLNSTEFKDIIEKMLRNPHFSEFKTIFESYGVEYEFVCTIFKELFLYYNGIFYTL